MAKKRQIPPVERVRDDQARAALSAIKERLEDLDDIRGEKSTSALISQDLVDAGLIEIDKRGTIIKKEEDEQVQFKNQDLLQVDDSVAKITTADLPDPELGPLTPAKATAQNQLINELKSTVNDIIDTLKTGQFQ